MSCWPSSLQQETCSSAQPPVGLPPGALQPCRGRWLWTGCQKCCPPQWDPCVAEQQSLPAYARAPHSCCKRAARHTHLLLPPEGNLDQIQTYLSATNSRELRLTSRQPRHVSHTCSHGCSPPLISDPHCTAQPYTLRSHLIEGALGMQKIM